MFIHCNPFLFPDHFIHKMYVWKWLDNCKLLIYQYELNIFCLSFQITEILSIHLWIESLLKSNFWRILDESWCKSFHENFKDMTYIFSLYVVFQIYANSQDIHSVWICLCAFVKDKMASSVSKIIFDLWSTWISTKS